MPDDSRLALPRSVPASSAISIRGARVHNLRNVSLDIPHDKLTVVTGVSGSGKSSLVFDTIYAEGQRRYVESLSAYARQFLERMEKPDVDEIIGIAPPIAIKQKNQTRNPRSTVATATEIYDFSTTTLRPCRSHLLPQRRYADSARHGRPGGGDHARPSPKGRAGTRCFPVKTPPVAAVAPEADPVAR